MKPQKKDYKLIIEADNNNEVYWKLLKKGELAAHNQEEMMLAEEMLKEILGKMEKFGYWHKK
jgi:hypothetical protein